MAYESELFGGSLVLLVALVAYRVAPLLSADGSAARSPLTLASVCSPLELLACAGLVALLLISFVLLQKKRSALRAQRRAARLQQKQQQQQQQESASGEGDQFFVEKAGEDLSPHPNLTPARAPFLCTVPSLEDYKKDAELRVPMVKRLRWPMVIYLGGLHAMAVYWVLRLALGADTTRLATYAFAFVMYALGGLGITAGAHRLWSHRSYKAAWPLRVLLMLLNSMANQGSVIHWSRDHRTHHLFSDTTADPYDASRGVFFSHVGWLLLRKHSRVLQASRRFVSVADLWADPLLALQERLDPWWNLFWCFVMPSIVPMQLWGESAFNAYLVAGVLKYLCTLHVTWSVNSIVHKWGRKPYNRPPPALALEPTPTHTETLSGPLPMSREDTTTESPLVALMAVGEGWHCWHHAFAWDYAAAELEPHQQFNPTKMFIDACAALGLVTGRKRALGCWALRKQRWLDEARAAGRVSSRVELRERLEGWPLFRLRAFDVRDPPAPESDAAPTVAPPS